MAKKIGEEVNFYYINRGQAPKKEEEIKKKKAIEREKRVKQNKKQEKKTDLAMEKETVIEMKKKNKEKREVERKRKPTKEEIKQKKREKRIKIIVKTSLLLVLITGGVTFAMISPIFNIKEIQVVGNEQVSKETIISLSELKTQENIFRFFGSKVVNKIKENAYIEKAKIHRKIPNIIEIEVKEREHNYSIDFLGKYAYANKQGYILEIAEDSKQKIILQGILTPEEQIVPGNRLQKEDLEKLEDVIKILNVTKEYELQEKITSINIANKNEYSIYLEEEKKRIHLGDNSNLSNKMLYANAIIEKEKGKAGEIFANGELNNKFKVYFRESLNV